MRVTMAQINPTVGDLEGNFRLIARAVAQAIRTAVIWWYSPNWPSPVTPSGLLERPWFVEQAQGCLQKCCPCQSNMKAWAY